MYCQSIRYLEVHFDDAYRREISFRTTGATFCPEQLNGVHHLTVLDGVVAHVYQKALVIEYLVLEQDFFDDLIGRADEVGTTQKALLFQLFVCGRRPAPFAPDFVHHCRGSWIEGVNRILRIVGDESMRIDTDRDSRWIETMFSGGLAVEIEVRGVTFGHTTDDGEGHRQAQGGGALTESGVPPTATQMGSSSCTGRGR